MRRTPVVISYNPKRDVKDVVSGLSVNVTDMMKTGIVKDSSESLDNNGIDDPSNIIGLVRDEFAALDAQRAIRKYGKRNKEATQSAAESAVDVSKPTV